VTGGAVNGGAWLLGLRADDVDCVDDVVLHLGPRGVLGLRPAARRGCVVVGVSVLEGGADGSGTSEVLIRKSDRSDMRQLDSTLVAGWAR
jgi:hypothetical protein